MSKYLKEKEEKVKLTDYLVDVEKEYEDHKNSYSDKWKLHLVRIKHILSALGEVEISKEIVEAICKSFDSSKCRYGTICLKKDTIRALYEISELFPELSGEAILCISKEYIKDLFEKYSFVEALCMMFRREGISDSTFEKFMDLVKSKGDEEDKKYDTEASHLRMFYGEYPYAFIQHFQKFIKQHHITLSKFGDSIPDPEFILKDQVQLKEISMRAKDCWDCCAPVSYSMIEDYLDGDLELTNFEEQPTYYISNIAGGIPTTFTKTDFLNCVKEKEERQKQRRFRR